MNLHVVAYPELNAADMDRIQACRREHNSLYGIIGAHLTLVFSVSDMAYEAFAGEVRRQSAGVAGIDFCMRCATVNRDAVSGQYDVFLVPDEGNSAIIKLHDRLYSDVLAPHHRLDIPYVPHLSIAASPDAQKIKRLADEWNANAFAIKGRIAHLDIINYENRVITTVERIALG